MASYNIKIADKIISVNMTRPPVVRFFQEYMTDETAAEIVICPTAEDKNTIRQKYLEVEAARGEEPQSHSPSNIEIKAIHNLLAHAFVKHNILLVHGSAVVFDGKAYLFIAPSGTGKSTHTRLWCELLGERAYIINDDKQMIRIDDSGATVHATPWGCIPKPMQGERAPLAAIVNLTRGETNEIRPVSSSQMFSPLFGASLRGENGGETAAIMALEYALLSNVKLYSLKCNQSPDAAKTSFQAIT